MNATATRVQDIPKLRHDEAMRLAKTEHQRFVDLLRSLDEKDWGAATDCARWTVKDIVAHMTGTGEAMCSPREFMRQQKAGKAIAKEEGLSDFDGFTDLQVRERRDLNGEETRKAYEALLPRFVTRRDKAPKLLRQLRFPSPPFGWFSMGYLLDDVLTRDTWMHRVDITRATGRELVLIAEHDGRFVANIVAELAKRWKRPFTLELSGPAGGTYVNGDGGESFRLDAVEFCRILSGRGDGAHPLHNVVPF